MKLVFYTNFLVPHQLPLAKALANALGVNEYKYIYKEQISEERKKLGYPIYKNEKWCLSQKQHPAIVQHLLTSCEVLISEERIIDIFEERTRCGRISYYASERWFKPIIIHFVGHWHISIPGVTRLLFPSYRRMAFRLAKLIISGNVKYMAQGVHAVSDILKLCSVSSGKLIGILERTKFQADLKPFGHILCPTSDDTLQKAARNIYIWGYFVAPSMFPPRVMTNYQKRLLWVGRLLHWKHVDTIIRAIGNNSAFTLDVYGVGPEIEKLKRMSNRHNAQVNFHNPVPYDLVRETMQNHDVFILSSDENEGWGATVNEAMEEHMKVLGTFEAGSSATMLPRENLFNAGDWRRLREKLENSINIVEIGEWSAAQAATRLLEHFSFA